jgi:hypothetical protein
MAGIEMSSKSVFGKRQKVTYTFMFPEYLNANRFVSDLSAIKQSTTGAASGAEEFIATDLSLQDAINELLAHEELGGMELGILMSVNPGGFWSSAARAIPQCKLCVVTDTSNLVILDFNFKRWALKENVYEAFTTMEESKEGSSPMKVGSVVKKSMQFEIQDISKTLLTATPEAKAIITFESRGKTDVVFVAGDDLGIEIFQRNVMRKRLSQV